MYHSVTPPPRGELRGTPPLHRRHQAPKDDQEGGNFVLMYHKLHFPKFDVSYDPLSWLNRCENYFCVCQTPDHKQVSYASFHLLDNAQLWYHLL
jgi:hypothetical protein